MRSTVLVVTLAALVAGAPAAASVTRGSVQPAAATWGPVQPVYAPSSGQMYAYAPSAVTEGGQNYVYTCHNDTPGVITDHVYFTRLGVPREDRSVLRPSTSGWDSTHTCDPTVIAATVRHGQKTYRYVMFYLGTDHANTNNQIGVAFAESLGGPWVKHPTPIVTTPFGPDMWGVGQPSATTIDPATGELMLFYSQGGPTTESYFRYLNLGDLGRPVVGAPVRITNEGLGGDVLHNFDIAYEPGRDRFYAIREAAPYPSDEPSYISARVEVVSIPGGDVWGGTGRWTSEGFITPAESGFPRNHNPGLLRTVYGTLPSANEVTAVFTVGRTGSFPGSLWSYRLFRSTGTLR
ncbi:hypothetical protein B0I31_104497 [Saccharothrix carnea]|uniref:Glycosyl hydrolase family 43 n=1 Tax=Saccharothrix carnea TaxID=1280637 RepID=A0A2P8ICL8_SACCR|nr:hypothetical protein [Saccharothrix carnea]PSL56206.1 hypothetical protein B0I31_104497 [Saccharothrix carnea]